MKFVLGRISSSYSLSCFNIVIQKSPSGFRLVHVGVDLLLLLLVGVDLLFHSMEATRNCTADREDRAGNEDRVILYCNIHLYVYFFIVFTICSKATYYC